MSNKHVKSIIIIIIAVALIAIGIRYAIDNALFADTLATSAAPDNSYTIVVKGIYGGWGRGITYVSIFYRPRFGFSNRLLLKTTEGGEGPLLPERSCYIKWSNEKATITFASSDGNGDVIVVGKANGIVAVLKD